MIFSVQRALRSVQYFPHIVQKFSLWFISMHLINFIFNQSMIYMQEQRMSAKTDVYIPYMLAIAFVGFMAQSLIKVLWTLLVCHYFKKQDSALSFLKHHTEQGLIESLRAFFKCILWGFLLIIPGFIKMIRYQFVLFVVALSKQYDRGNADALKSSEELTQGHFFGLTLLVLIFAVISFSLNSTQLFTEAPFSVLISEVISFIVLTLESTYLLLLFQDLVKNQGSLE